MSPCRNKGHTGCNVTRRPVTDKGYIYICIPRGFEWLMFVSPEGAKLKGLYILKLLNKYVIIFVLIWDPLSTL